MPTLTAESVVQPSTMNLGIFSIFVPRFLVSGLESRIGNFGNIMDERLPLTGHLRTSIFSYTITNAKHNKQYDFCSSNNCS